MGITNNELSALTTDVRDRSAAFAARIQNHFPTVLFDVGNYSNDAFVLRSYVSFRADNDGDELAVTVDITAEPAIEASTAAISIESDICLDDGTIIATGPRAIVRDSAQGSEATISAWFKEFDAFLIASEHSVLNSLEEMISKKNKMA
jgi:hypothetical protein